MKLRLITGSKPQLWNIVDEENNILASLDGPSSGTIAAFAIDHIMVQEKKLSVLIQLLEKYTDHTCNVVGGIVVNENNNSTQTSAVEEHKQDILVTYSWSNGNMIQMEKCHIHLSGFKPGDCIKLAYYEFKDNVNDIGVYYTVSPEYFPYDTLGINLSFQAFQIRRLNPLISSGLSQSLEEVFERDIKA